jgi:two-component system CheB/CheR fusion protein
VAVNNPPLDPKFEALLEYLRRNRGFDFTGYKRSSLVRRVQKRMSELALADFAEYIDYLEVHPGEFNILFNTMLINVTAFFRDRDAWDYLEQDIIPRIIAATAPDEPIRVWSAGCASGQEAYTIAIILCEALGSADFHKRVKIYATDIDEEALAHARQATYTAEDLQNMNSQLVDKYFSPSNGKFVFRSEFRRSVIYGRHDLVQDAPISQLNLLICRNTLMYLNAETQARIIARMHFALKPSGFLFLGKAEMLLSHASMFAQVDLQHRVFSKVTKSNLRDRLLIMAQVGDPHSTSYLNKYASLRDLSLEHMVHANLTVDGQGNLSMANERARALFAVNLADIGRPFQDLEISYRPVEIRSLIEQCCREKRTVKVSRVARPLPGTVQLFDVLVSPLNSNGHGTVGVSIAFEDVTEFHRLYDDLQSTHEELETTNEELQSTNEELETTNEELQSTNEELETTNEELQSTNEELETTNEELQSTNEALQATSEELRVLSEEVFNKNIFLDAILSSMNSGVIVVDGRSQIRAWNQRSEDLWGLRADEVIGSTIDQLDIGLPTKEINALVREKLSNEPAELSLQCVNRRGRTIHCTVKVTPLSGSDGETGSVIFIEEAPGPK